MCRFTRMTEVGIRNRQVRRWILAKPQCPSDIMITESITIQEVATGTIFLYSSFIMSSAILTIEIWTVYFKQRKMRACIKMLYNM